METYEDRFDTWWRRALVVAAVIAVGLLVLTPPVLYSGNRSEGDIICRPIVGSLVPISERYGAALGEGLSSLVGDREADGVARGCQEARLDRQTILMLLLSAVVIGVVVLRRPAVPVDDPMDAE